MRPITVSVTNVGTSDPVGMDILADPFNVGIGCVISGTPTFTVRHSFESPPVNWFPNANVSGATGNADTNYMFPVLQIRLAQKSGSGSVTMIVLQTGPGR